jgi:hypothetical protein
VRLSQKERKKERKEGRKENKGGREGGRKEGKSVIFPKVNNKQTNNPMKMCTDYLNKPFTKENFMKGN